MDAAAGAEQLLRLAMLWIHSQNHRWESGKYRPLATKIVEEDEPEMCGA